MSRDHDFYLCNKLLTYFIVFFLTIRRIKKFSAHSDLGFPLHRLAIGVPGGRRCTCDQRRTIYSNLQWSPAEITYEILNYECPNLTKFIRNSNLLMIFFLTEFRLIWAFNLSGQFGDFKKNQIQGNVESKSI